jgi:hypothetical protein
MFKRVGFGFLMFGFLLSLSINAHADYLMPRTMQENIGRDFHRCAFQNFGLNGALSWGGSMFKLITDELRNEPQLWNQEFGHFFLDSQKATQFIKTHPITLTKMTALAKNAWKAPNCTWTVDNFAAPTVASTISETAKNAVLLVEIFDKRLDLNLRNAEIEIIATNVTKALLLVKPFSPGDGRNYLNMTIHDIGADLTNCPTSTCSEYRYLADVIRTAFGKRYTHEQFQGAIYKLLDDSSTEHNFSNPLIDRILGTIFGIPS